MDRYEKTDWIPNVTLVAAENLNRIEDKVEELTNFQIEKESNISDALSELEEAKKDFNGVERASLSERLTTDISYINDRFNNSSLIAYEDKYISANNTYDGVTKNLKIKGETLQNLCTNTIGFTSSMMSDFNVIETSDYIKITKLSDLETNWKYAYARINNIQMIKTNTIYTVIVRMDKKNDNGVFIINGDATNSMVQAIKYNYFENGILKVVIQTKSSFTDIGVGNQMVYLSMTKNFLNKQNDQLTIYKNPILLEGDYSNKNVPFFQGMKSVGEEGTLDLISCGKNLFDGKYYAEKSTNLIFSNNTIYHYGYPINFPAKNNFKPSETYTVSIDSLVGGANKYRFELYSNNTKLIDSSYKNASENFSFVMPNIYNEKLKFKFWCSESTNALNGYGFKNPIIEKGTSVTEYEPYKESKIIIPLKEPLRSLPSGVCDEIDFERNKIIRRICKMVLNGKESWGNKGYGGHPTNNSFEINIRYTGKLKGGTNVCYCDTWVQDLTSGHPKVGTYRVVYDGVGNKGVFFLFSPDVSKIPYRDTEAWKKWLSENPITIYYELSEPIEEDINVSSSIRTFDGITNIFTKGSTIEPIISCKIPSNVEPVVTTLNSSNDELNEKIQILNEENNNIRKINQENSEAINIIDSIIKTL